MAQRIGVLLVHGIGEQGKFEHLEAEVRNLVTTWNDQGADVQVRVNSSADGAFGATSETWCAEGNAPVQATLRKGERTTVADFHEIWWADLDEPPTFVNQLRFWFWGLSLWNTRRYVQSSHAAFQRWMRSPAHWGLSRPGITGIARARLFGVGMVMLLALFTVSVVNVFLRALFRRSTTGSEILVNYLGDVKLYQQQWRSGRGPLCDVGRTPRVALRRRMVRGMVRMAMAGYDRWYIFAHSQGTVLALNGIMEPGERIPHYLDEDEWERCKAELRGPTDGNDVPAELLEGLQPPRPSWLNAQDRVDRSRLFERLRGVLTYGSPLETFAALWPAIVPLNQEEQVFRDDFEWINVVDPTDPVATRIRNFDPLQGPQPQPRNVSYKAAGWHLLSHIRYFAFASRAPHRLVHRIAGWLEEGTPFQAPQADRWHWPDLAKARFLSGSREATWILMAASLGLLLGQIIDVVLGWIASWIPAHSDSGIVQACARLCATLRSLPELLLPLFPPWLAAGVLCLFVAASTVFLAGLLARIPYFRRGKL